MGKMSYSSIPLELIFNLCYILIANACSCPFYHSDFSKAPEFDFHYFFNVISLHCLCIVCIADHVQSAGSLQCCKS